MQNTAQKKQETILDGFDHINRYWDRSFNINAAKILPGEYYVTRFNEDIVTVLGSCISACIRDRKLKIGGMNHFMLPENNRDGDNWSSLATRYGSYAMEHMINDILKNGGSRKNLEVKITGGGKMFESSNDIGIKNILFVRKYIETEKLLLVSEDVGDIFPRKVRYNPLTGSLKIKKLKSLHNKTILDREKQYSSQIKTEPVTGDVELF